MRNTVTKRHTSLDGIESYAVYSLCERYRYWLQRVWSPENNDQARRLAFLMLNPSTATELENDPTVHRCERRAREGGYNGFIVLNIFAFRATDPKDMKAEADPVGEENNDYIRMLLTFARRNLVDIVCAWGVHGSYMSRDKQVLAMMRAWKVEPMALGLSKDGHPKHPLYIGYDQKPFPYLVKADE